MNHFAGRVLFTAVFCFITPMYDSNLAEPSPPCQLDDHVCLAHFFTGIVQRSHEFPHCKIPPLYPYVVPYPLVVDSAHFTSFLTAKVHWSDFTIHGSENMVVEEVRNFPSRQANTDISLKIYFPTLKVTMNTKSILELYLTQVQTNGKAIINMENVRLMLILKTKTEQRNGKDYLIIDEVCSGSNSLVSAERGEIDFRYDDTHPAINSFINQVANTKFQICKGIIDHSLDKLVAEIYRKIFSGIFDGIAIQELYCMK